MLVFFRDYQIAHSVKVKALYNKKQPKYANTTYICCSKRK